MFWIVFSLMCAASALCWLFFKINKIDNEIKPRNAFTEMKEKDAPEDDGPIFMAPAVEVPPIKKTPNIRLLGHGPEGE